MLQRILLRRRSMLLLFLAALLYGFYLLAFVSAANPSQFSYTTLSGSTMQYTHSGGTTTPVTLRITIAGGPPAYPVTDSGWANTLPIGWTLNPTPTPPYTWSNGTSTVDVTLTITAASNATAGTYFFPSRLTPGLDNGGRSVASGAGVYFTVTIDNTPPSIRPVVSGALGDNGWYVSDIALSWSVSDPGSGIASSSGCSNTTITTDTAGITFTCTATNGAGLTSTNSITVKRDATPPTVTASPSRSPDSNGWYNHALTISFSGADSMSGIASCTAPVFYSGFDSPSVSVSGACTDNAGNTATTVITFAYDATPPTVTVSPSRNPDNNGWYNHAVTFTANATDDTSGVASCDPSFIYSAPDSATASVTGECTDVAGNIGSATYFFEFDSTPPTVLLSPSRLPDSGSWYNHAVQFSVTGSDATSGVASCTSTITYTGPDSATASVSAFCTDNAGNQGSYTLTFRYDATPPSISITPSRSPDSNGWYNHTVNFSFGGTDAISGIASCSPPTTYSGPDSASKSIVGSCTDNAGNTVSGSISIKYDATPPSVAATASRLPDQNGWYNHAVTFTFTGSDALSGIASCDSSTTYSGPDSATAFITGACKDLAGNQGNTTTRFQYDATPPSVEFQMPSNGSTYSLHQMIMVNYTCTDVVSGIATCTGTLPTGSWLDTTTSGTRSLVVNATDIAGNSINSTITWKVLDGKVVATQASAFPFMSSLWILALAGLIAISCGRVGRRER